MKDDVQPNEEEDQARSKDIQKKVGEQIRKYRKQNNWTLEDLAQMSGLHPSSISQMERGERNLTLRNLFRLAKGLNVQPFQLFLFDQEMMTNPKEATEFKVQEMLEHVPEGKQQLLYHLSRMIRDWKDESVVRETRTPFGG